MSPSSPPLNSFETLQLQAATSQRHPEHLKLGRLKYYYRDGVDSLPQAEHYQNVLATFLSLRLSLSNEYRELRVSRNNATWSLFGDLVIETANENGLDIHAVQCKQIQTRSDISLEAVAAEKGKFSLKKQFEVMSRLRKKEHYRNTLFRLFTLSGLKVEGGVSFAYDDAVVARWRSEERREQWRGKKAVVALLKKNTVVDTTDDADNVCIFKLTDAEGRISGEEEGDLSKFSLLMNQRKTLSLKRLIRMMVEDKFGNRKDISEDLIQYFNGHFKMDETIKWNCAITKRDVLLKVAELLLAPFTLSSEGTVEGKAVEPWDGVLARFDMVVLRNRKDSLDKIYNSINSVLTSKIRNINGFMKSFTVDRSSVVDDSLRSEIFDTPGGDRRKASLRSLHLALWKVQLTPLILRVDDEETLTLIMKVISFLHAEDLPLKFILMTGKDVHPVHFPEPLKVFTSLQDVKGVDGGFLDHILDDVRIPFLNFSIPLREIADRNSDCLAKVTPDVLLNMSFDDYSFSNMAVPLSRDVIENTLVFEDQVMRKVNRYFRGDDDDDGTKESLSYVVNVNGRLTSVEVPPDI